MNKFEKSIIYATEKHSGAVRKMSDQPYILHPMEVAAIAATMTSDEDVLCAAVLHDVVEDAGVTLDEIKEKFGERVAELVASETENKMANLDPALTWNARKEQTLKTLKYCQDIYIKILWLSDKLSNARSFDRMHQKMGDKMWENFHQSDNKMQEWYYRTIASLLADLREFPAYSEYLWRLDKIFKGE